MSRPGAALVVLGPLAVTLTAGCSSGSGASRAAAAPEASSFDRALFLTGEAAATAATAHGEEVFDYDIQNDNRLLRSVKVSPEVLVIGSLQLNGYAGHGSVDPQPQTISALLGFLGTKMGRTTPFHLVYGVGGEVTRVEEQYLP